MKATRLTGAELLRKAAEETGEHAETMKLRLRFAGWDRDRLEAEIQSPGWPERLKTGVLVAHVERVMFGFGPEGAHRLTDAECEVLISPKLKKAVARYSGGAALLLGPTGTGKTLSAMLMARKVGRKLAMEAAAREPLYKLQSNVCNIEPPAVEWAAALDLELAVQRYPLGKGTPACVTDARRKQLLVLDDLTWAKSDATTLEVLGGRAASGLPTIITAACTREVELPRFGGQI